MVKQKRNAPTVLNVYLGSGEAGERLRKNIEKTVKPNESVSEVVVALLRKADPNLFKGVDSHGK